jgi:type II secretory pathway predicted ATPase ExeA/cell division septation protein DedD
MSTGSLRSFQPQSDVLTYEPFFGLKEKAFSLNADPRFLYESPSHAATFESLVGGIRRREGVLVLTGEIGTGKTTLCRAVVRSLGRKTFSSFVPDPFASREDLLKTLLIDFGVMTIQDLTTGSLKQASRTELSYLLASFLDSLTALDAFVVVIIDEAQNMSLSLIEETRILSDSFGSKGRLQIVFVGQPELQTKLKLPEMRQVDQRVCGYSRLAPLAHEAVAGYVQHRLHVAGATRVLFPADVIEILHRRSGGVPRLINRICDRALHLAHQQRAAAVDRAILDTALLEVGATTLTPTWESIMTSEPAPAAAPPVAAAPPPVVDDESFELRVDQWVEKELAPPSRHLTDLHQIAEAVDATPAPPTAPEKKAVRKAAPVRPALVEWADGRRSETYLQRLARLWMRRAAVAAAGLAGVTAMAWGVSLFAELTIAPPALPGLPAPPSVVVASLLPPASTTIEVVPIEIEASQPAAAAPEPVAAPRAVVAGDYLVSVGLFANRERADQLVAQLTQAGLPVVQRPFQLRRQQVQRVVLGPFATRADAEANLQSLRRMGGHDDANVVEMPRETSAP